MKEQPDINSLEKFDIMNNSPINDDTDIKPEKIEDQKIEDQKIENKIEEKKEEEKKDEEKKDDEKLEVKEEKKEE